MPRFSYKAVSAGGAVEIGEREARDRASLIAELQHQGYLPIRAEACGSGDWRPSLGLTRRPLRAEEVAHLIRELAVLLRAGLPLDQAVSILAQLTRDGSPRRAVEQLGERLRAGQGLAEAFAEEPGLLPPEALGLLRAGEAGGNLVPVLERLAESLERALALKAHLQSALQYPLIVLAVAALSIAVLVAWVIPGFRPLFEDAGAQLPLITQLVIAASDILRAWWWTLPLLALATALAFKHWTANPAGRLTWDRRRLTLPLIGDIIAKLETARACRTLGTLLANGVTALEAVSVTAEATGNSAVAAALRDLHDEMAKGQGLAGPMAAAGLFPPLAVQLAQVGEASGRLDAMLLRVAEIYESETRRSIERLLALLVPTITVALGVLVAVIMSSMLMAILSAYDLPI